MAHARLEGEDWALVGFDDGAAVYSVLGFGFLVEFRVVVGLVDEVVAVTYLLDVLRDGGVRSVRQAVGDSDVEFELLVFVVVFAHAVVDDDFALGILGAACGEILGRWGGGDEGWCEGT